MVVAPSSATRLTQGVPWLCGPASRRVCHFVGASLIRSRHRLADYQWALAPRQWGDGPGRSGPWVTVTARSPHRTSPLAERWCVRSPPSVRGVDRDSSRRVTLARERAVLRARCTPTTMSMRAMAPWTCYVVASRTWCQPGVLSTGRACRKHRFFRADRAGGLPGQGREGCGKALGTAALPGANEAQGPEPDGGGHSAPELS